MDSAVEVKLAMDTIEEYCQKNEISDLESRYEELAEELVSISYSIGGYPSKKILEKMVPEYIKGLKEQ